MKDRKSESKEDSSDASDDDMNDRDPQSNNLMENLFNQNLDAQRKDEGNNSDVESRESVEKILGNTMPKGSFSVNKNDFSHEREKYFKSKSEAVNAINNRKSIPL